MKQTTLNKIKTGELFTLKPIEYPTERQVYEKTEYLPEVKKWGCVKYWDALGDWRILKGSTVVYIDFTF